MGAVDRPCLGQHIGEPAWPNGDGGILDIVKIPGTSGSYWGAASANKSANSAVDHLAMVIWPGPVMIVGASSMPPTTTGAFLPVDKQGQVGAEALCAWLSHMQLAPYGADRRSMARRHFVGEPFRGPRLEWIDL